MTFVGWILVLVGGCADPYVYEPTCDAPIPAWTGDPPTWSDDVQPLIATRCQACHVAGGLAPTPFETYAETAPWASVIAAETASRVMPPFPPTTCGECGTLSDAIALTDDEIALLGAWADGGAPEGDPTAPPTAPLALPTLPSVDATMTLDPPYTPDAAVADDYRCFLVDPGLAEDRYLTGYEVIPGQRQEVHHASVAALDTEAAVADAQALDAADDRPGWACFGGFGFGGVRTVAGYVPGSGAKVFPDGTGIPLTAGRPLAVQVHYNTLQGAEPDATAIHLMLADAVDHPAEIQKFLDTDFVLPGGEPEVSIVNETRITGSGFVYGLAPHEHGLGSTIRAELVHDDGTVDCLIDVPNWDFHWQGFWFLEQPVKVRPGDTFRVYCEWDTTSVDHDVAYGESTTDEMCTVLAYVAG
ncbi:MAG: hypothetical protein ABMB14_07020 [Myxococcota bacterium]